MNKTNVYGKLSKIRLELQNRQLKKSGQNKFAGFKYYELGDILPTINELSDKYGILNIISYSRDEAVLEIIDIDNPESKLEIKSPMSELTLKGAHPIQNLGAIETYQRRYLYLTAYEIVESDYLDAIQGKDSKTLLQAIKRFAKAKNKNADEIKANLEKKYNKTIDKLNSSEIKQATEKLVEWSNKC